MPYAIPLWIGEEAAIVADDRLRLLLTTREVARTADPGPFCKVDLLPKRIDPQSPDVVIIQETGEEIPIQHLMVSGYLLQAGYSYTTNTWYVRGPAQRIYTMQDYIMGIDKP